MPTMNMIQAIRSGLEVMLERDPNVCVFGEDVGYFGGVFRATQGLQQRFGPRRVFDTPLAEGGIIARRDRHGDQRPAAGARDSVFRLHVSRRSTRSPTSWPSCAIAAAASGRRR